MSVAGGLLAHVIEHLSPQLDTRLVTGDVLLVERVRDGVDHLHGETMVT